AFSQDGKRLATASADHTVKVWDTMTGREALTMEGHTDWVTDVAFSPDGKLIALASADQTVKVRDAANGEVALIFDGHHLPVHSLAFSPDGKRIASANPVSATLVDPSGANASYDVGPERPGKIMVWDTKTGRELLTLLGPTGPVTSVVFSPDGTRMAS